MPLRARKVGALALLATCAALVLVWKLVESKGIDSASAVGPLAHSARSEAVRSEGRLSAPASVAPAAENSTPPSEDGNATIAALPVDQRAVIETRPPHPLSVSGRIVDARTGQGLPLVLVSLQSPGENPGGGQMTDSDGRFVAEPWTSNGQFLRAVDRLTGKVLGRRRLDELPAAEVSTGVVWPVEVGPTLILELVGAPDEAPEWRARLLERDGQSEHFAWSWRDLQPLESQGVLAVRYRRLESEDNPAMSHWIQVSDDGEVWKGELRIDDTPGVHTVAVRVAPVAAAIRGRVVDQDGAGVEAEVAVMYRGRQQDGFGGFVLRDGGRSKRYADFADGRTSTDDAGAWRLEGLEPGPARILISPVHRDLENLELDLTVGENPPLEVVVPRSNVAGSIRANFVGSSEKASPQVIVHLDSVGAGFSSIASGPSFARQRRTAFEFRDLPAGQYCLRIEAIDGRSYVPETSFVSPPATVEIRALDDSIESQYGLVVRDAATGAELLDCGSMIHLSPFWWSEIATSDPVARTAALGESAPVALVVGHEGYRPAFLNLPEGYRRARREGGRIEIPLDLEPGYGLALVVLDGDRSAFGSSSAERGLAGAHIVSDGRVLATSNELGVALVACDGPFMKYDVVLPGWSVAQLDFEKPSIGPGGMGFVRMRRE
jgi:hypothetical protein